MATPQPRYVTGVAIRALPPAPYQRSLPVPDLQLTTRSGIRRATASRRGRAARRKGRAAEQEAVRLCRACGLEATRSWWLAKDADPALRRFDLLLTLPDGRALGVQVKRRKAGLAALYEAIEGVAFALLREDGKPWIAAMPAERLLGLLRGRPAESEQPE